MKIELTELELLHVLAMLDTNSRENDRMHAKLIHHLDTGLLDELLQFTSAFDISAFHSFFYVSV